MTDGEYRQVNVAYIIGIVVVVSVVVLSCIVFVCERGAG